MKYFILWFILTHEVLVYKNMHQESYHILPSGLCGFCIFHSMLATYILTTKTLYCINTDWVNNYCLILTNTYWNADWYCQQQTQCIENVYWKGDKIHSHSVKELKKQSLNQQYMFKQKWLSCILWYLWHRIK